MQLVKQSRLMVYIDYCSISPYLKSTADIGVDSHVTVIVTVTGGGLVTVAIVTEAKRR